jgi:hypothetical protein
MALQQQQPDQPKAVSAMSGLKNRYLEALEVHVLNPMRHDLVQMQAQLRSELSRLDLEEAEDREIAAAGLEHELLTIERVLRVLDQEYERAKTLRLSDYNAPVGATAGAELRIQ